MTSPAWRVVPAEATEEMLAVMDTLNPPSGPPETLTEEYCERWKRRHRKAAYCTYGALVDRRPPVDYDAMAVEVMRKFDAGTETEARSVSMAAALRACFEGE